MAHAYMQYCGTYVISVTYTFIYVTCVHNIFCTDNISYIAKTIKTRLNYKNNLITVTLLSYFIFKVI